MKPNVTGRKCSCSEDLSNATKSLVVVGFLVIFSNSLFKRLVIFRNVPMCCMCVFAVKWTKSCMNKSLFTQILWFLCCGLCSGCAIMDESLSFFPLFIIQKLFRAEPYCEIRVYHFYIHS